MGFILIKVGQGNQNDIIINNSVVSEEHCELFVDVEGNVFLTDLGSTYGTFINDSQMFDSVELFPNDKVMLANTILLDWQNYIEIQKSNTYSIGASPFNRIVFDNPMVNEFHAELQKDFKENIILTDLKSNTGTFVNEVKIVEPVFLQQHDVVKVGDCVVQWQTLFKQQFTGIENTSQPIIPAITVEVTPETVIEIPVEIRPENKPKSAGKKSSFIEKYKEIILIWGINIVLMYLFSLLI